MFFEESFTFSNSAEMFGVTDLSEPDNWINFLFLCLKFYLHRWKFQQTNPNFVAFLNLVKIKGKTEYKIAEDKGKLRLHFKKWTLDLEASWIFFYSFVYLPDIDHIPIPAFFICVESCVWMLWEYFCWVRVHVHVFVFCPLFCVCFWVDNLFPFFWKKNKQTKTKTCA